MSAASAARPGAAPLSEPARILNTLVAPSKTFGDLRRVGRWWVPWLLVTIVSLGFTAVVAQKIGIEQVVENQIRLSPKAAAQLDKLPPDQRASRIAAAASFTKAILYASPAVNLLFFLIVAAALMASFNFGAGAEIPFATSLAVVAYGFLPTALHAILATISVAVGANPDSFNIENPVATNPAYFMDPSSSPALYNLASRLDVFILWTLILLGIGFSAVSKLKRSTSWAVVFGWYILIALVRAGWAAAFS